MVGNGYGTVALLRRSLLDGPTRPGRQEIPIGCCSARLRVSGARIVSVPLPLVTKEGSRARLERTSPPATGRADGASSDPRTHLVRPGRWRGVSRVAGAHEADAPAPVRSEAMKRRRVAVVASEVLGMPGTGGPGTADSLLALALARHGDQVDILVAPGREIELTREWERRYEAAHVNVRPLEDRLRVRPSFLWPTATVFDALRGDPPMSSSPTIGVGSPTRHCGHASSA